MKITFLGASHGVPEANRRCSCTMVEVSGRYYFVDMGIMAIDELVTRGIPVDAVKGIFITHMHGDHTNGLFSFVDLITWYFKNGDPEIFLPRIEGAKIIQDWLTLNTTAVKDIRYREVTPGVIFDDGLLKVTAIGTQHCQKSYAYLLEAEGKRVLFTGDLKRPAEDFPAVIREGYTDLVVCEAAHFPTTEYLPVFKGCRIGKVVVNHYANWNIPNIQQLAKDMNDVPVSLANDGMEVQI